MAGWLPGPGRHRVAKGFTVVQIDAGLNPDMDWYDERGANEAGFPWDRGFTTLDPAWFDTADLRIQLLHCHTDNVRTERCDAGTPHCQGDIPYARPLPTAPRELGRGEDQPFPGLHVSSLGWRTALAVAATGQRLTRQIWRIARAATVESSIFATFVIRHDLVHDPAYVLAPGARREFDGT